MLKWVVVSLSLLFVTIKSIAQVQINSHFPITTPEQFVMNSDLECLDPEEDQAFNVSKDLKYVGMLSSMKDDTIDLEKWEKDVRASLKMGNIQAVEFLDLSKTASFNQSFRLFKKKLLILSKYQVGVIVIVQELFFDSNGHLKSDYASSWKKLKRILMPFKNKIKGFYLFDEPYWNIEVNKQKGNKEYVSIEEMTQNLTTVGTLLHQSMPSIPLIFVEAYTMVNEGMIIPDVFDWVGMDCYTGFDDCQGKSIPEYYRIIQHIQPNKKLVVLPPAIIFKKPSDIQLEDRLKLKNIYTQFMNWVATEPKIVISMSFMYRFDQTSEVFTGANKICEVADSHRLYWRKFYRSRWGL